MADFMFLSLVAGVLLAISAAPLGCFVVWRRMAYYGDALAHSALLGVVIGLFWEIPLTLAIVPIAVAIAFLLSFADEKTRLSSDTLLGIIAHGGLALGITIMAMTPSLQVDLMAYLFGDILAVTVSDILIIATLASSVIAVLWTQWRSFVLMTLNEDLATVQGIKVKRQRFLLMLLVALTVAMSIKLVGLLLITSLLILPAATARFVAHTPPQMAVVSVIIALSMVVIGLLSSFQWDTPSGPSIVLMGVSLFTTFAFFKRFSA